MAKYTFDTRQAPINLEIGNDQLRRTMQNVKNLMMCRMGEIPYDRKRGINPALFDLPINEANDAVLPEIDRVLAWEPNAAAVSAWASLDENGETVITAVVDIKTHNGG